MVRRQRGAGNGVNGYCTYSRSTSWLAVFGGAFFLGCLFRRGWFRLLGRALDDVETTANKGVDAGPWPAQIREHNLAFAFLVAADSNVVRCAGALNSLALGHTEGNAARHRWRARRRFQPLQA